MSIDTQTAIENEDAVADGVAAAAPADDALVEEELLVEEVSIDGMCGVY